MTDEQFKGLVKVYLGTVVHPAAIEMSMRKWKSGGVDREQFNTSEPDFLPVRAILAACMEELSREIYTRLDGKGKEIFHSIQADKS